MAAGKVCTGFSKPYVALYSESAGTVTYSNCRKLARGVSVNISPDTNDSNDFYADNVLAESDNGVFTGGTLTVTVDGLHTDAERMIMGAPEAVNDWIAYGDTQSAPYVGFGCIARYMSDGVTTYVPIVIAKNKFNQVPLEATTQGQEIDWQTEELTARMMRGDDSNHNWKYLGKDYTTEEAAEDALVLKLGGTLAHSITQTLTHITSSLSDTTIDDGEALEATLTADTNYQIDTVTVSMGGTDITSTAWDSTTSKVSIASVTGDVVITAVGSEHL